MFNNNSGGILSRLLVVNLLWVALLGAAWNEGWLQYLFTKDITFISHGIAIAAVLVIIQSIAKGWTISNLLHDSRPLKNQYRDRIAKQGANRSDVREAVKSEMLGYTSFIGYFATTALSIGVLGTVIGLILGFQNVDPAMISNVENAGATVAQVLSGLAVAFHTTLVGGIANLWLRTNHFMLIQGQSRLYANVMEG